MKIHAATAHEIMAFIVSAGILYGIVWYGLTHCI